MARFFVELEHDDKVAECARVVQVFLQTGSHYLTHADWGCKDGEHKAWLILDAPSKEEARCILPPAFRSHARIVKLNKVTLEEIDDVLSRHQA